MRKLSKVLLMLVFGVCLGHQAKAQFYQVYGYTNLDANEKELVMWNTFIPSSDHSYDFFNETVPRSGLLAHSFELEYGISRRFTVAFYADFEQPQGSDMKMIGTKAVMMYYRYAEKNYLPVDLAVYAEYKLPREGYKDYEEIELKLILEKDLGLHRIVLNPTFEKKISGEDVTEGVEFALNGSYTFMKSMVFQPKLEYYSKMGELYELNSFGEQKNYIFPSFDLFLGKHKKIRWHAGVGIGLTDPADNVIIKSVLSWEFI